MVDILIKGPHMENVFCLCAASESQRTWRLDSLDLGDVSMVFFLLCDQLPYGTNRAHDTVDGQWFP